MVPQPPKFTSKCHSMLLSKSKKASRKLILGKDIEKNYLDILPKWCFREKFRKVFSDSLPRYSISRGIFSNTTKKCIPESLFRLAFFFETATSLTS